MADQFSSTARTPTGTARKLVAITPADTDLTNVVNALYVGGAGNVAIMAADDSAAVTLTAVPAGSIIPIQCKRVMATNTTATGIVGLR